jgi:anti-sigma regulatory factor (Ser/Thr protein kinase)
MMTSLARVEIRYEQDVVHARQRARLIAEQLGFDRQDQTRISTAVSEIARNAHQYGKGGDVEFMLEATAHPPRFTIAVRDHGPGIVELDTILEGHYTSRTGMGLGIVGCRRLLEYFHINTRLGQGTTVTLGKSLPLNAPAVTPAVLRRIADALAANYSASPMEEIRAQNQELVVEMTERNRISALLLDQSKLLHQEVVERRSAQQELEALNRELEERVTAGVKKVREKDQALMQNEKLASLGQLAAGIVHEINNPMGYIASNLSVLGNYFDQIVRYDRISQEAVDGKVVPSVRESIASSRKNLEIDDILEDGIDLIRESLVGTKRIMEIVRNLKNFTRTDSLKGEMVTLTSCLESALIIAHNELKYVAYHPQRV